MPILKDCLENTSAHGLPQLVNSKNNLFSKLLWASIITIALILFLIHSITLIKKFDDRDTATSIELEGIDFIFPDIYICRMSFWSNINLKFYHYFKQNDKDYRRLSEFVNENVTKMYELIINKDHPEISNLVIDKLMKNTNFTDFVPNDVKINDSSEIPLEEIFYRVPHSIYHSCYKMKEQYKKPLFMSASMIPMFVDYMWYKIGNVPSTNPIDRQNTFMLRQKHDLFASSHTVLVTPKDEYPHFHNFLFFSNRAQFTLATIEMKYYRRINLSKKPCRREPKNVTYLNYLNHSNPITYKSTPIDCAVRLYQEDLLQQRNCVSPILPIPFDMWKVNFTDYCQVKRNDSADKFDYAIELRNDFAKEIRTFEERRLTDPRYKVCDKEEACEVMVYSADRESVPLEHADAESLASLIKDRHPYQDFLQFETVKEFYNTNESLRNSFTIIVFKARKLKSRQYTEKFSYQIFDLFSDLEGIMGFYMGMSLITILEIVAYFAKCKSDESN